MDQNEINENEIKRAKKRNIEFNEIDMRHFSNVNSAIHYFEHAHSKKSIVAMWQKTLQLNVGSISILVFDYKTPETMKKRLESILITDQLKQTFEKMFEIWLDQLNGINRLSVFDANRIIMETKSLEP